MSTQDIPAGSLWLRVHGDPAAIAFDAVVEPLNSTGSPHELCQMRQGVSILVRAVAAAGDRGRLFVISADICSAAAFVMTGLLPGDAVRVEGVAEPVGGLHDKIEPIQLIRRVYDLQLVDRAIQPWQQP